MRAEWLVTARTRRTREEEEEEKSREEESAEKLIKYKVNVPISARLICDVVAAMR